MKNKKIEKKLIKMLDNKIVANIVRFTIIIIPVLVWAFTSIITSKI